MHCIRFEIYLHVLSSLFTVVVVDIVMSIYIIVFLLYDWRAQIVLSAGFHIPHEVECVSMR